MNAVIVDTNVIVLANDPDDKDHTISANAPDDKQRKLRKDCIDCCQDRLKQIISHGEKVVIDNRQRILREYRDHTNPNSRKGIGDIFVKRLLQNLDNPAVCKMAPVTPLAGNSDDFAEFPNDHALAGFHKKDRKFIAAALAYQRDTRQTSPILLAMDRPWLQFIDALANHGVSIDLICEKYIRQPRQREKEK